MRIFTKISRVPFRHLRSQGHNLIVYADDYITIFSTITKKSYSYTQTLQEPSTTSKTSVNSNQDINIMLLL